MAETDPKSVQDLTNVVQTLLQQMQDKFQTMSDQIIGRNILTNLTIEQGFWLVLKRLRQHLKRLKRDKALNEGR
ncbi:hypothetical protein EPR50_G00083600 [Perca flavescens]|uniref:Heat shock factor-binding protein 1 n=1 Tax=Perca flavescens TaxID=8167 RepID=A0A484D1J0_PERFV|nr:hypothetical protein EPR50_G00083600 [Perca flavescens]